VTACSYDCPDACPLIVKNKQSGPLLIGPDPTFPLGFGFICDKGKRWESVRTHPERIKSPLLKNGSRWDEISWDKAWSVWAARTERALSRNGPLSIFFSRGYGSLYFSKNLLPNFFAALGGYSTTVGSLCGAAGGAGLRKSFGTTPVMLPETVMEKSNGVLLWGRNAAVTNRHLLPLLSGIRNRGGGVVSIEVRETETTRISDKWWRIRPGSDGVLALGLCATLYRSGLLPDRWKVGVQNLPAFEKLIGELDLRDVEEATSLKEKDVVEIAEWILKNGPVAVYPGYGIQRYMSGSDTFNSLVALAVMIGGLSEPGCGVVFGKDEMALFPDSLTRQCAVQRKLPVSSWYSSGGLSPGIDVAVFCGSNPAKQSPGSNVFTETLSKIPYKVCCDLFMTETARMCDLVLPSSLFLEEGPDWRGSWWHQYVFRSLKVCDSPGEVLTDLEIFDGLARKMGVSSDLEGQRLEMDSILRKDSRLRQVSEGVYYWDEPEHWGSGKYSVRLPEETPKSSSFDGEFRLISVHSNEYINGQTICQENTTGLPIAVVSLDDLGGLGALEGSEGVIRGESGSMRVVIKADSSIPKGICIMKQGIPGVNSLTIPLVSPGYGAPFHENRVSINMVRRCL